MESKEKVIIDVWTGPGASANYEANAMVNGRSYTASNRASTSRALSALIPKILRADPKITHVRFEGHTWPIARPGARS